MSPLERWLAAHEPRYRVGASNNLPPLPRGVSPGPREALDTLWWRLVDEAGLRRIQGVRSAA